ncbi:MAG: choice-of-anchor L domain-containing protein [Pseudomonadota bacterium]
MKCIDRVATWCLIFFMASTAHAQVIVSPLSGGEITVPQMVDQLLNGSGTVTVLNSNYSGALAAAGVFTGGNTALGFSAGVILSTGLASNLVGTIRPSNQNGQPGSPEYFSGTTSDAALLSFSFIPSGDKISFRLRFLTIEGFGSVYNDAFGIFVNGSDQSSNVARLPNGNPVTVSNIIVNGPYYESGALLGLNDFYKSSPRGSSVILQADASVLPNQENTITFAIADSRDSRVDSVVLIEAGTFFSNSVPQVHNAISDQQVVVNTKLNFKVPDNTFGDADGSDTLTYSAQLTTGSALPSWLSFDPLTRVITGTPTGKDIGSLAVRVRATDPKGAYALDDFVISVVDTPATPTPEATPAPTETVIRGRASAIDGMGIAKVMVYVREASTGAVHGSGLTSAAGEFSISGLAPTSKYSLTLSRTGYTFPTTEAMPGVYRDIVAERAEFFNSQCRPKDIASLVYQIHTLACDLRSQALTLNAPITTRTTQAKQRVQNALDGLTVWLDQTPEVSLQCRVQSGCKQIALAKPLKRLGTSLAALNRSAQGYADVATGRKSTNGASRVTSKDKAHDRRVSKLFSRAQKAIGRLPSVTYRCP